jgi:hypothetical protein
MSNILRSPYTVASRGMIANLIESANIAKLPDLLGRP